MWMGNQSQTQSLAHGDVGYGHVQIGFGSDHPCHTDHTSASSSLYTNQQYYYNIDWCRIGLSTYESVIVFVK